jgi:iron complex outermembrane receptor protein
MIKPTGFNPRKNALVLAIGCALGSMSALAQVQETTTKDDAAVEEVIVKGVRASQAKAIDIKRSSAVVVDSIVAEDIGKLPDTTITDSLQRVTGVQIKREAGEGTSLNVRGMPQVLTTLNGEQFLSPWSINKLEANFSDIPAGLISGVDVFKSQTASMLAGGVSGVVDLKTWDPSNLDEGFMVRARVEGSTGEYSGREYDEKGNKSRRDPDYNVGLVGGFNNGDNFSVIGSLYKSESYNANYSMYENQTFAFLDRTGGTPHDPYDLDGDGDTVNDWYIVPEQFSANGQFVERERFGGSLTGLFEINENWSVRGDVFYTEMDKYDRGVSAQFNAKQTPDAYQINNAQPKDPYEGTYNSLQPGSIVSPGSSISFTDVNGNPRTIDLNTIQMANVWAADFQSVSKNTIEKTAAYNTNFEVKYTDGETFEANFRIIHAKAEMQQRQAFFQQGTPGWLWVDDDEIPGKDPVDGFRMNIDYRGDYPAFSYDGDVADANFLKQYQGFAEGFNSDAELNVARVDWKSMFDFDHFQSLEVGVRAGERKTNFNKFWYVTPTGRYSNYDDPRVPADKKYRLLPGNMIWQKFPDWLKFNYSESDLNLVDIGGLPDNGFTAADTTVFYDFGPIKGFENGVAALSPNDWDNPYEFMNRLYPGTRTVNEPGETYAVTETTLNSYIQFNFANDADGIFGVPYNANVGIQVAQTDREVVKSVVPDVLDSFNSIGYDDWQKIAYIYESDTIKNSSTELLPSIGINIFPTDDLIVRFSAARTMTRNDMDNIGSSAVLWYGRCVKTDEDGNNVVVKDPNTGADVPDTVGCVGGGSDRGQPDIKPWLANVYNLSTEWYFDEGSILGVGFFLIDVDTAVQSYQEQRHFLDMDGMDRNRFATVWSTRNTGAADLYGVEFGYKQPFSMFDNWFINRTGIEFNYTYSHSESEDIDIQDNVLPLVSNSENQANLILWYDYSGLNVRLAYNWRSEEYVGLVGVNNSGGEVFNLANWAEPVGYLDLSVSYNINDNINVFISGTNLTEQSRKTYTQYESQFHSLWVQEPRYAAGVNLTF